MSPAAFRQLYQQQKIREKVSDLLSKKWGLDTAIRITRVGLNFQRVAVNGTELSTPLLLVAGFGKKYRKN